MTILLCDTHHISIIEATKEKAGTQNRLFDSPYLTYKFLYRFKTMTVTEDWKTLLIPIRSYLLKSPTLTEASLISLQLTNH